MSINFSKEKVSASYKTIYMKNSLIDELEKIAHNNDTSFNNTVIKMLEYCVDLEKRKKES